MRSNDDLKSISDAIPYLVKALEVYTENNKPEPIKLSTIPHHKYFWTFIFALIACWGYWLNWRAELVSAQITNVQETIRYKRQLFTQLDKSITNTRLVVLNQRLLCDSNRPSPIEQQIERNKTLLDTISINSISTGIIDETTYNEINAFLKEIYTMEDVCKYNRQELDEHMHQQYRSINSRIGLGIKKDYAKLEALEQKDALETLLSKIAK